MTSLPKPRAVLTSLIDAISAIRLSQPEPAPHRQHPGPGNPLKSVPPSYRPLLTTLHVLFPTLLLPALDLLDRRLVSRLWLVPQRSDDERYDSSPDDSASDDGPVASGLGAAGDESVGVSAPELAARNEREARSPSHDLGEQGGQEGGEPVSHIFTVKSAQSAHPTSRRKKDTLLLGGVTDDPGQKIYIVRLGAWNCTCAAFAFAAFPGGGSHALSHGVSEAGRDIKEEEEEEEEDEEDGKARREADDWEFGGSSLDGTGTGGGGVPCCKHLLACLLAERWASGFGGYIEERRVGRNEMAGIVADV
jgi:hypothetical protein